MTLLPELVTLYIEVIKAHKTNNESMKQIDHKFAILTENWIN